MLIKSQKKILFAQQIACAIIVAHFVLSVVQAIRILLAIENSNIPSMWFPWYISTYVVLIVIFAVFWTTSIGSKWDRAYQASILTVASLFWSYVASSLYYLLIARFFLMFSDISRLQVQDALVLIVPQVVFVAVMVIISRRQKSSKKALLLANTAFVISVVSLFAASLFDLLINISSQYSANQNLSAYVVPIISLVAIGLLTGIVAFVERRRGGKKYLKTAIFVTSFGAMALYTIVQALELTIVPHMAEWVGAFLVMLLIVCGFYAFRWLYRTLRVLPES